MIEFLNIVITNGILSTKCDCFDDSVNQRYFDLVYDLEKDEILTDTSDFDSLTLSYLKKARNYIRNLYLNDKKIPSRDIFSWY
ncbi:MAG: hypothetical protein ACI4NE_02645 [Succinivibrio sp.]